MNGISQRIFWPYDEVKISRDAVLLNRFFVNAPWLTVRLDIDPAHADHVAALAAKLESGEITGEDLPLINGFFTAVAQHPFSYLLPRTDLREGDTHSVTYAIDMTSPKAVLLEQGKGLAPFAVMAAHPATQQWTWDTQAAIDFSRVANGGLDPRSLFSVARRFHLLNDLEWNKTSEMLDYVKALKNDGDKFRAANAVILRQNHYVTEQCDRVLRAALPTAQNAKEEVLEFIQAEAGHDKLLARAVKALGADPNDVQTIDSVIVLMEIFAFAARKNFLAFAMIVDIFERTSFHEEDPMAMVLKEGGETNAGRHIHTHRKINDEGGHENVALEFLETMGPVDDAYALEALRLAELATLVIHQLSAETLKILKTA